MINPFKHKHKYKSEIYWRGWKDTWIKPPDYVIGVCKCGEISPHDVDPVEYWNNLHPEIQKAIRQKAIPHQWWTTTEWDM